MRMRMRMSRSTCSFTPGRSTFTTTSRPLNVRAECTCATEAAAKGSGSKRMKSSCGGLPSASSIAAMDSSTGKGFTLSCSFCSSARYSGGKRSVRRLRCWPSFTKVAPRSCSKSAKRRAGMGEFTMPSLQPDSQARNDDTRKKISSARPNMLPGLCARRGTPGWVPVFRSAIEVAIAVFRFSVPCD